MSSGDPPETDPIDNLIDKFSFTTGETEEGFIRDVGLALLPYQRWAHKHHVDIDQNAVVKLIKVFQKGSPDIDSVKLWADGFKQKLEEERAARNASKAAKAANPHEVYSEAVRAPKQKRGVGFIQDQIESFMPSQPQTLADFEQILNYLKEGVKKKTFEKQYADTTWETFFKNEYEALQAQQAQQQVFEPRVDPSHRPLPLSESPAPVGNRLAPAGLPKPTQPFWEPSSGFSEGTAFSLPEISVSGRPAVPSFAPKPPPSPSRR